MTDTDQLINQLAARAGPVRPLAPAGRRTTLWLMLAIALIAVIVATHGGRPDGLQALLDPGIAFEWIASLLTAVLAAYAVFQVSVPGRSSSWAWLPLPAALLWLGSVGLGCMRDFARLGDHAFAFESGSWECACAITLTSIPLGLLLLLMVRHAGVVRPGASALLTALSAAALSAAGVSLIHAGENSLMVLFWHVGAVTALSALSWLFGRQLFAWLGYARHQGADTPA